MAAAVTGCGDDDESSASNANIVSADAVNLAERPASEPERVRPEIFPATFKKISAGFNHTCALGTDSLTYCWGADMQGSLGDTGNDRRCDKEDGENGKKCRFRNPSFAGTDDMVFTSYSYIPVKVQPGEGPGTVSLENATDISSGYAFTCAITGGKVYCWGTGSSGQLGNGDTASSDKPVTVCAPGSKTDCIHHPLTDVVQISAGNSHVCAIVGAERKLVCWGSGDNGRLGNNDEVSSSTPVYVCSPETDEINRTRSQKKDCEQNPLKDVSYVAAGNFYTCAVAGPNKTAYCWGDGSAMQLGNNETENTDIPLTVCKPGAFSKKCSDTPFEGVKKFATGQSHTCAITEKDGSVYCWGQNHYGQLGNNDFKPSQYPTAVCRLGVDSDSDDIVNCSETGNSLKGANDISSGYVHACVSLGPDKSVSCWGESFYGRLGDNGTHNEIVPVRTLTGDQQSESKHLEGVSQISLGSNFSCALHDDFKASCWGNDYSGQLGNKERINLLIPGYVSAH